MSRPERWLGVLFHDFHRNIDMSDPWVFTCTRTSITGISPPPQNVEVIGEWRDGEPPLRQHCKPECTVYCDIEPSDLGYINLDTGLGQ